MRSWPRRRARRRSRRARQEEQRVVAEAAVAARREQRFALPAAVGDQRRGIVGVAHQRRARSGSARGGRRGDAARAQRSSLALFAASRRRASAGVARRVHARARRRARRRTRPESSASAGRPGGARRVARLGERVLDERRVRLLGLVDAESPTARTSSMPEPREQRRELASLPRLLVATTESRQRGPPRLRRRRRAPARCSAISSPMPLGARSSSASSSCAREGVALGGALHLDEAAAAGHHDVHVGVAPRSPRRSRGRAPATPSTMPTETAATWPRSGICARSRPARAASRPRRRARRSAPVIAAVRVPPSACSTSQSSVIVRSPSALQVDHRAQRCGRSGAGSPACGRSACRAPLRAALRVCGRARQHAVLGRDPALAACRAGTAARRSSTLAVHSTRVSPNSTSTEPSAWRVKWRANETVRSCSAVRPLGRIDAPVALRPASAARRPRCCRCAAPRPAPRSRRSLPAARAGCCPSATARRPRSRACWPTGRRCRSARRRRA